MIRRYRGYTIEASSSGDHAQVRLYGDHQASFHGHTSYDDAKRWVDREIDAAIAAAKGEVPSDA